MTLKGYYALCYANRAVLWGPLRRTVFVERRGDRRTAMVPLDTAMTSFQFI